MSDFIGLNASSIIFLISTTVAIAAQRDLVLGRPYALGIPLMNHNHKHLLLFKFI